MPHAGFEARSSFTKTRGARARSWCMRVPRGLVDVRYTLEALRAEHHVITWDARGFGRTEWDGKPFTYQDRAAVLLWITKSRAAVFGGKTQRGLRLAPRGPLGAPCA